MELGAQSPQPRTAFRGAKPARRVDARPDGPRRPEVITLASVYERVRSIVAERLGVDEDKVTQDAEFIADLNADSLDLVEVIMAMEQEFDLEIKDDEAENIRTVADAVRYIEEHSS
jgi:acyl carrier protein